MRYAIAYHKNNTAGKNIVKQFRKKAFTPQIPVIELKKETIYSDINSHQLRNIDFLIFASSHKSKDSIPSLCLHSAGNWRSADLGGKEGKICPTYSYVMKYLFQKLNGNAEKEKEIYEKYRITMEATHHGPFTDIPCCFIELGSLEEEYRDEKASEVIAKTILSLNEFQAKNWVPCIGIGGTHYCPNFNKIQLYSNYAISHVIPKYSFPVTENMIKEAEEKTKEQIKLALIDWKSIKSNEKQNLLKILDKLGLKYEKTSNIKCH